MIQAYPDYWRQPPLYHIASQAISGVAVFNAGLFLEHDMYMLIGGLSVAGINFQAHLGRHIEKYLSGASFSSQLPHFSSKSKYLPRTILRNFYEAAVWQSGNQPIGIALYSLPATTSLHLFLGASLVIVFVCV